jgi:hypothetical protein
MVAVAGGTGPAGKSLTQALMGEGGQVRSECLDEAPVATLRDGSTVLLRRLDAADIDAVIALHDALSNHERYLRFFTPRPPCLKTCARKLTGRSDKGYALGAFESGELIGVANYVVCHEDQTAEVALVVAHNDHLRGVGTALLRRLSPSLTATQFSISLPTFWSRIGSCVTCSATPGGIPHPTMATSCTWTSIWPRSPESI